MIYVLQKELLLDTVSHIEQPIPLLTVLIFCSCQTEAVSDPAGPAEAEVSTAAAAAEDSEQAEQQQAAVATRDEEEPMEQEGAEPTSQEETVDTAPQVKMNLLNFISFM